MALTLGALALLMLGATMIAERVDLSRRVMSGENERWEQELAMASAESRMLWLLAVVQRGTYGLGFDNQAIRLDGRPYRLKEGIMVSFQDTRGLVNLVNVDDNPLGKKTVSRLLSTYGLSEQSVDHLSDTLLDFSDMDRFRRINGAEVEDYPADRQAWVRNESVQVPEDLARVLDWDQYPQLWGKDAITRYVTTAARDGPLNPNTASWRVLFARTQLDAEQARSLVQQRQQGTVENLGPLIFAQLDPMFAAMSYTASPGKTVRLTLRPQNGGGGKRYSITATPSSTESPWLINYVTSVDDEDEDTTLSPTQTSTMTLESNSSTRNTGGSVFSGSPSRTIPKQSAAIPELPDIKLIQSTSTSSPLNLFGPTS